jgi:energy-coupling factor transporter ATP-binding protein EcfA2
MRSHVAARLEREAVLQAENTRRLQQALNDYEAQRDGSILVFERQFANLVAEYKRERDASFARCVQGGYEIYGEEQKLEQNAARERDEVLDSAHALFEHKQQKLNTEYKEKNSGLKQELEQFEQLLNKKQQEYQTALQEVKKIVERRMPWPTDGYPPIPTPSLHKLQHAERFSIALQRVAEASEIVRQQPAARFVEDGWPILLGIFSLVPWGFLAWNLLASTHLILAIVAALMAAGLTGALIWVIARPMAANQTLAAMPPLRHSLALCEAELNAAHAAMRIDQERFSRELQEQHEAERGYAQTAWDKIRDEQTRLFQQRLEKSTKSFLARRQKIETDYEQQSRQIAEKYPQEIHALEQAFEKRLSTLHQQYLAQLSAQRELMQRETTALEQQWSREWSEFQTAIDRMNGYCDRYFPVWEQLQGNTVSTYHMPTAENGHANLYPVALRFGRYEFDCRQGHEQAQTTLSEADSLELPAVLSYPESPSLLFEAEGEGRDVAVDAMRNVMLRLLTSFPPGKVRFTIIDPVGLGQNFSAFMHLADYDERLVSNRIWTESSHVNQKLADLTEHMENVIQKYLRNEFSSIQEYNAQAGEVAEPFHILVVANFPANFSDEAARRLVSIAASGARCGVYTLISTDMKLKLPRNFDLADLESQATTLCWDQESHRFVWKYPEIQSLSLQLENPPSVDHFTHVVRSIGQLSKDAARVEVPFASVLPAADQWWTCDSRAGIDVPLGRAGAKKMQFMRLGKGTSQHVLISGKTGSGKSTLLNALITTLAAYYSPKELEFYLIDFKKGVEFKAYATQRLPHARVIAIESEREFGMSVLERLDGELKVRGDLFRSVGVQDLKGYRQAKPEAVMPRIMLIIDEFQEFFTSDDKISHDSALLLDRLVRQGRAFGIHVLLGSQTLAGAYSLARSTLGQMAVRIALQCSESDAHLILSEDNTAARLLSRPGEAIYNDANGLFEGNHPFQVVWLSDQEREKYLHRVATMAEEQQLTLPSQTVFEGNAAANAAENILLRRGLQAIPSGEVVAPRAWLGAAVAIKEPTSALFRRQGGANLLIVGQQEEMALGTMHTALVSLASQLVESESHSTAAIDTLAPIILLDGSRADGPEAGFWTGEATATLPQVRVFGLRDVAAVIKPLAAEVERRLAENETNSPPLFLFIYNLARFRELKKSDDFGISSFSDDDDSGTQLDKQFATILREGPAHGVHTLVWCDSYNNVNRWLERSTLREFDLRVLFQMSATDSSNLMDNPAAGRLGAHMALLYSEELGQSEKFRPYGLPSAEWLQWIATQFQNRKVATST